MKKLAENLAELVKVKTIVTFIVVIVFAILAVRGDITPDNVQDLVMVVIAFYFGSQAEKRARENTTNANTDKVAPNGGDLDV